jgi:translocation and assembly module TamB
VLRRRIQNAELTAEISRSELSVTWQGPALEAKLSLVLAGYGNIDASLQVPLPAGVPIALDSDGPLRGAVKGSIRENGLLSFVFPGLVQESRGQVDLDLALTGTWKTPVVKGAVLLDKAGGYFPAAGIRLADVHAEAKVERNAVRITLKARSDPGWLQGKAIVDLEAWSVVKYEGTLQGERFRALFQPQMRMLVSPALRFSGTKEKLVVRGDVRVPELLIYGPPEEAAIKPSEDVVIVGQREQTAKGRPLAMDADVRIILGERVIVKAEGADAQLKGNVIVAMRSLEKVTARGEISVVKGKYSAYGVGLDIARGRVLFAGGPIENPSLDILAVKTVDEVKAGVLVTGTVRKPVVKLYSQPAMTDADVLSYIVLGRPLGAQDKEQTSALMTAAGALLSAGQSAALQDQMKQRLGVDVIDIQAGGGETSRSLVTIGKYLSSRLYVSYGRALFTGENLFKMRYKLGKRLELESHSGETSGVDLFYTVQFD